MWHGRAVCWLKSITSVATPDTFGFSAAFQVVRATVHSGNHFSKLLAFTDSPTWCRRRMWSTQFWGVPFQCEHHATGHHQSWPRSRWYVITCHTVHDMPPTIRTRAYLQATKLGFYTPGAVTPNQSGASTWLTSGTEAKVAVAHTSPLSTLPGGQIL